MFITCPPHCLNMLLSALLENLGPSIVTTVPVLWTAMFNCWAVWMIICLVFSWNAGSIGKWHIPCGCLASPS
jgi:hypothetical protein